MSTLGGAVAGMGLLAASGALPAWRLAGKRPVTVFLAPLAGAVLAGVSGGLTVLVAGSILRWFVALAVAANAAALASLLAHREERRSAGLQPPAPGQASVRGYARAPRPSLELPGGMGSLSGMGGLAGLLAVVAAVSWGLSALVRPRIGFDARGIWLLHARWMLEGHAVARAALSNPALPFAHSSYPPLAGGMVALVWTVTSTHTLRLGEVMIALCSACAVAAAGCMLVEAGTSGATRLRAGGAGRLAGLLVAAVGVLAGGAWCLAAYGVAGASATNGYVDLLWSAAAVGAAGYGLLLPASRSSLYVTALLVAVAALTKNEGIAASAVLVVLLYLRYSFFRGGGFQGDGSPSQASGGGQVPAQASGGGQVPVAEPGGGRSPDLLRRLVPATIGLAGVVAWPALMLALGALPDPDLNGRPHGSLWTRMDATARGMADHLHLAGIALALGIVGAALLGRARRRMGFGDDRLVWALGGAEVLATGIFYVAGTTQIQFWLATSVDRTTIFANVLGLAVVGFWAVGAAGALVARSDTAPAASPPLAGTTPGVLHRQHE